MKYNGIEVKEFTSDKPVVFDPPKKMLVWDDNTDTAIPQHVCAFVPNREEGLSAVICKSSHWQHCAEIPKEIKPRNATYLELAKWLMQGKGLCKHRNSSIVFSSLSFDVSTIDNECDSSWIVLKWDDDEWHEPTVDYMGLEDLA